MDNVVEVRGLWKLYGKIEALRNVSLDIPEGSIYLLMGPNGSGKSTLLKILTGLVKPTEGTVKVHGMDPWKYKGVLFRRTGAMFEDHNPPGWVSGEEYLIYKAELKRLRSPVDAALEAAEQVGITSFWRQPISTYSSGMRRKLALADALIGDPDLLILDEPAATLDKESRQKLKTIIQDRHVKGKTTLISTHVITELEDIATHIAIIHMGEILLSGDIQTIINQIGLGAREKPTIWKIYFDTITK